MRHRRPVSYRAKYPAAWLKLRRYIGTDPKTVSYRLALAIDQSNVPPRHRDTQLSDPHPNWEATFQHLWNKLNTGFIAALVGNRGTAKTQLGTELALAHAGSGFRSWYTTAGDMFDDFKKSFDEERIRNLLNTRYRTARLLVIDEIDKRFNTDFENQTIFQLLDYRYRTGFDTLLLGNIPPEDLCDHLGPSILRRINETAAVFKASWPPFPGNSQS